MRSLSFPRLLAKEFRELLASRAFWLLLLFVGFLVGHSFTTAIGLYAEMSGSGGGPAALPQGLTPLDGILVPTWELTIWRQRYCFRLSQSAWFPRRRKAAR